MEKTGNLEKMVRNLGIATVFAFSPLPAVAGTQEDKSPEVAAAQEWYLNTMYPKVYEESGFTAVYVDTENDGPIVCSYQLDESNPLHIKNVYYDFEADGSHKTIDWSDKSTTEKIYAGVMDKYCLKGLVKNASFGFMDSTVREVTEPLGTGADGGFNLPDPTPEQKGFEERIYNIE